MIPIQRAGGLILMLLAASPLAAQGSRMTNAGVVRAAAQVDSVFQSKTVKSVTIDVGDFTAYLLARIGVASFSDSSGFRVSADSTLVHVRGRLLDFSAEKRRELGALMLFVDSTATLDAEISMPQSEFGVMRFRLERLLVNDVAVPEIILGPVTTAYASNYRELAAAGREFHVAMPELGKSVLQKNTIRLYLRPAPPPKKG